MWWKLIGCGCYWVSFLILLFPFPSLAGNEDILGVGCLDRRDFSAQLDQVLLSYGNMRWAHNSCRAQSDSKHSVCLLCPAFCLAINTALWKKWQRSGLCPVISVEMWAAKYWVAPHKIVIHEYPLLLSNAPLIRDMTVQWWKIIARGLRLLLSWFSLPIILACDFLLILCLYQKKGSKQDLQIYS